MNIEARTKEYSEEATKLLGADRAIVLAMRRELRAVAKPVGERMLGAIAEAMPKRGGLAARIRAQGRVSMLVDLKRGVRVQLSNKGGLWMGAFESGTIRHPVFGNRKNWRAQTVPGGKGMEQFDKEAPALADRVVQVVTKTAERYIK